MSFGPLVDSDWLHTHLDDVRVRVIDFRWYLLERDGREEYLRGHVPGAAFVDLEAVTGREGGGRHPLPTAGQFDEAMRRAGVGDGTQVVVYDDAGGSIAARLWFLLRWFGHDAQAVLDGGLQAWGAPIDQVIPELPPGDFTAREPDRSVVVDFEAVRELRGVPLLDARAPERYRGETEPVDPKAGHIPGAKSRPWKSNLGPDGRFKAKDDLRREFVELGAEGGAVAYCGSGVNACHNLLAMELAGMTEGRLYAGSWSDWSSRDAPVATGAQP
ncbi:MAG: sulfurtransferase [Candidatus Dormibacterales bacterium]